MIPSQGLQGSNFADRLIGDGNANRLLGEVGNDILAGGGGADTLTGGLGNDSLDGGDGADTLTGGFGADVLIGEDPSDTGKLWVKLSWAGASVGRSGLATQAIAVDKFLTGAFRLGAQVFDRWQARVEVATENEDDFVKNLVTILAEERLALAVYRPEAFVKGAFAAASLALSQQLRSVQAKLQRRQLRVLAQLPRGNLVRGDSGHRVGALGFLGVDAGKEGRSGAGVVLATQERADRGDLGHAVELDELGAEPFDELTDPVGELGCRQRDVEQRRLRFHQVTSCREVTDGHRGEPEVAHQVDDLVAGVDVVRRDRQAGASSGRGDLLRCFGEQLGRQGVERLHEPRPR